MKYLNYIIGICFALFVFSSCSQDEDITIENNNPIENPLGKEKPVEVVNGILKFANTNQMFLTLNKLHEMENSEFQNWEKSNYNKFTSQRTIFNAISDAENQLVEMYKSAKSDIEKQQILNKGYSDLYIAKKKVGFITESIDNNGYSSFDYSMMRPYFAPITNEIGMYAVGDTIFQITSSQEKMWVNGDFNKISILERAVESDSILGITVQNKTELRASKYYDSDWQYSGSYRFKVSYDFKANATTSARNLWKVSMAVNFATQHNGGMWPFKKWGYSDIWPLNYSVKRQAQTQYFQSFYPYGLVTTGDPAFRTPSSGTNYVKGNNVWLGFCPFSSEFGRHDLEWMAYKNVANNGIAQLQQILDISLVDVEINAEFVGRKTIILTLNRVETK